ncbi:MAG TPA: hypothetical protein V6D17_19370 [Candidatus Obscuribacterales bacterium]
MSTLQTQLPLGELMIRWSVVSPEQLNRALEEAPELHLPVGLMLIGHDSVHPETLNAVISAQSLLRDHALELADAERAVTLVQKNSISFSLAMNLLGLETSDKQRNRIGELLVESESIGREQFKLARSLARSTFLQVGRIMTVLGYVSREMISQALSVQGKIRASELTRDEAIDNLYSLRRCMSAISNVGDSELQKRTRLGQLLVGSNLCDDRALETALTYSHEREVLVGEALVEAGGIRKEMVDAALGIQALVRSGKYTISQAIQVLSSLNASEADFAHRSGRGAVSFYTFLKLVRALPLPLSPAQPNEGDLRARDSALALTWKSLGGILPPEASKAHSLPDDVREFLQQCGFITDKQLLTAQRAAYAYKLFLSGVADLEKAIIEFHRMEAERSVPEKWSGTFPNLPAL